MSAMISDQQGAPASAAARPHHVPVAEQVRDGLVESVHYGSVIAVDAAGRTLLSAGEPLALFYPRSALKPLQATAMVRAGLDLPQDLLALTAASHSGGPDHLEGVRRILRLHGLDESVLQNSLDLPYGGPEREKWLRAGGAGSRLTQNCSGKHAAMAATCVVNSWPVAGYLDPDHPLQRGIAAGVAELTGEEPAGSSIDGCGTPLFAVTLHGMARAFGRLASAESGTAEAAVAGAMTAYPEQVAGSGRDVTALMRLVPGLLAKDGFEGLQLVGLADGRAVAVKIADGSDRARMPVTVRALAALGVEPEAGNGEPGTSFAGLEHVPVLGGGRPVGRLQAIEFLSSN